MAIRERTDARDGVADAVAEVIESIRPVGVAAAFPHQHFSDLAM
ncbi:hypothetical protein [Mesorhizobium sp. M0213]